MKLINVEFDGLDFADAPKFCDAFICYAEWPDGAPLTNAELDALPDEVVSDYLIDYIY